MNKIILLFTLILLSNCGIYHHVKGIDGTEVYVGPNFEKAMEICDDRYGQNTEESEECFQDYRNYTDVKVTLDLEAITEFCNRESVADPESCIEDLLDIFSSVGE